MARAKVDEVKKEVQEELDEVYGEETAGGSQPKPNSNSDVEITVGKTLGWDAVKKIKKHKPFLIGEEVEEDEKRRRES